MEWCVEMVRGWCGGVVCGCGGRVEVGRGERAARTGGEGMWTRGRPAGSGLVARASHLPFPSDFLSDSKNRGEDLGYGFTSTSTSTISTSTCTPGLRISRTGVAGLDSRVVARFKWNLFTRRRLWSLVLICVISEAVSAGSYWLARTMPPTPRPSTPVPRPFCSVTPRSKTFLLRPHPDLPGLP